MSVTPLGKMPLKCLRSFVGEVAAYFTVVRNVESMKLVKPVWDRFTVPAEWQVLRVVRDVIVFILFNQIILLVWCCAKSTSVGEFTRKPFN